MSLKSTLPCPNQVSLVIDVGNAIDSYKAAITEMVSQMPTDEFMALFGTPEDYVIEIVARLKGRETSSPHLAALCKYPQFIPIRTKAFDYFFEDLHTEFIKDSHWSYVEFNDISVTGHLAVLRGIAMEYIT